MKGSKNSYFNLTGHEASRNSKQFSPDKKSEHNKRSHSYNKSVSTSHDPLEVRMMKRDVHNVHRQSMENFCGVSDVHRMESQIL